MSSRDRAFVAAVVAAAERDAARFSPDDAPPLESSELGPHREAMRRVKLFAALYLTEESALASSAEAVMQAERYARALAHLQRPSGFFGGGDNIESAPDSSFTINDLGDTVRIIDDADADSRQALAPVTDLLRAIAAAAAPALFDGGVHTPNHRWELAAALCRLHAITGDARLRIRAEQWLAEGVDIDADGQYSERSANYAVNVSNPSLLAIADILPRPDLREIVDRNLASMVGLLHSDGTVETVHSRRQDQKDPAFPAAQFLSHLRRFAVERDSGTFAWAAERAARAGIVEPHTVLAEMLTHPTTAAVLPAATAPAYGTRIWQASRLAIDSSPRRVLVVAAGTDYSRMRRIRSGLSTNPTFLRMFAGDAVLSSVRLSRDFFGLGPFRADRFTAEAGSFALTERVAGAYYLPMEVTDRQLNGDYELTDEGRFAAAMSFDERDRQVLELTTRVTICPREDGVDIEIDIDGPALPWSAEFAFAPGGSFDRAEPAETVTPTGEPVRYRCGRDVIIIDTDADGSAPASYHPGEDYTYLGGTDAAAGPRGYVTGTSPGRARITVRAVRED